MARHLLNALLNGKTGEEVRLSSAIVYDKTLKKDLSAILADFGGEISGVKEALNAFLHGEADGGTIDRLVELVEAIKENRGTIDDLMTDKATKAELAEVVRQIEAATVPNREILEGMSINEAGNLVFNEHVLNGDTGIAFGLSAATASSFTGQLKFIVEELPEEESA